jgi:hypothetical protein
MIERLKSRDIAITKFDNTDLYDIGACGRALTNVAGKISEMRVLILTEPARFEKFPDPEVRKKRMDEEAEKLRKDLVSELTDLECKSYTLFSSVIKFDTLEYMRNLIAERDAMSVEESRRLIRYY